MGRAFSLEGTVSKEEDMMYRTMHCTLRDTVELGTGQSYLDCGVISHTMLRKYVGITLWGSYFRGGCISVMVVLP